MTLAIALIGPSVAALAAPIDHRIAQTHQIDTAGGPIRYTASLEPIVLRDSDDEPAARIVAIAYTSDDSPDADSRPVTFIFNGGPGACSVWLHLGFAGPKRVPAGQAVPGARGSVEALEDNPQTLLAVSDLVFIDPVGTGFSEPLGNHSGREFWSVGSDARSVARYIDAYLDRIGRPAAPIYLMGESYGGIRAAAMLSELDQLGLRPSGVILISPALSTRSIIRKGDAMSTAARLPSFAALAWYHDTLPDRPDDLLSFLAQVERFALTDYAQALTQRQSLSHAERQVLIAGLHAATGLPTRRLNSRRLRVRERDMRRLVLGGKRGTMGSLDARFVSFSGNHSEIPQATFGSGLKLLMRDELGIDTAGRYTLMNSRANARWRSYDGKFRLFGAPLRTIEDLEDAMERDPSLRVFVATGVYDLVTPYAVAHYRIDHSDMDRDRVTVRDYESGHMIYLEQASFERLSLDVKAFIEPTRVGEAEPWPGQIDRARRRAIAR